MKNISFRPKSINRKNLGEIIETEIGDWHSQHYLPRHICVPETQSHRSGCNLGAVDHVPRVCRIDTSDPTKTHLTLDILKYQLSDRFARQKHLENVRANLNRRLKIAQAEGNNQLVNILQDEYKQLNRI